MPRVLDPTEAAKLGLPAAPAGPRKLSADEVSSLGLDDEGPSEIESGLRGAGQGLTFGFGDEIAGGGEAFLDKLRGAHEAIGELYTKHRDESRRAYKKAEEANPNSYTAGNIGGAILPNAALAFATGGSSIPEQIALGAAAGGLTTAGEAENIADITPGQLATGVIGGGVAGGVGAGLGKLGAKGLGAIGRRVEQFGGKKAAEAGEALLERGTKEAAENVASVRGSAGKAVADANATLRTMREALADPGVSAERKASVQAFLESPAGQELRESVVGNALEAAPEKVGAAQTAKALYAAAQEQAPEEAKRLAEHYGSAKYLGEQALERAKRYGPRLAAGVLGLGHGGGSGLVEGAALGQIAGPAKDSIKRLMMLPGAQKMAYQGLGRVGKALGGNTQALGKYGAVLGRAAAKGPQELAAAHFSLAQKSPQYQEMLKHLQAGEDTQSEGMASASDGDAP